MTPREEVLVAYLNSAQPVIQNFALHGVFFFYNSFIYSNNSMTNSFVCESKLSYGS